jgi:HEXXH motif-containing protein
MDNRFNQDWGSDMVARLDLDTIRTLASPTGDIPLVTALLLKQYQKTLMSLYQLHQTLLDEAPELVNSAGFIQAFEVLREVPAPAQEAVLAYPTIRVWLDTAWNLVRRQSHLRFPEMHVRMHLEEFGRIVLAAVWKSGSGDFECATWTDARSRIVLPGAGAYLESSHFNGYQRVRVKVSNGNISVGSASRVSRGRFDVKQNEVPAITNGIELNGLDLDLRTAGQGNFDFEELSLEGVVKWQSSLEQAWAWISESSPMLATEMLMSVRAIIPVRSSAVNVHTSASFRETPGLIALSWTPDVSIMVEALVHEYHHQKLNTLLNADPIIVGPSTDAKYYSPWRPDARPLTGVLHGAFAFQAVLHFYKEMFEAAVPLLHETRIRQRMYLLKAQVQTALSTLRAVAQLSPLGESLVDAMWEKIDRLDVALPCSERAVQRRLDELQAEHRRLWEEKNTLVKVGPTVHEKRSQSFANSWSQSERRVLDWLHQKTGFDPASLEGLHYELDPLLNSVMQVFHAGEPGDLKGLVAEATSDESLLTYLIAGHVAYFEGNYESAATLYESCVAIDPSNKYLWQYFAFALRHLTRWRDALAILTNLGRLAHMSDGHCEPSSERVTGVEGRLVQIRQILAVPAASAAL